MMGGITSFQKELRGEFFGKHLGVILVPILLIVVEPDFGTATAYIFATVFILFVSGIDKKYIFLAIALVAILVPVIYINLPAHALQRIEVYLHPESDPRGSGYNIIQSKLAI